MIKSNLKCLANNFGYQGNISDSFTFFCDFDQGIEIML